MLVFKERGKLDYLRRPSDYVEKTPLQQGKNQQLTQPTYRKILWAYTLYFVHWRLLLVGLFSWELNFAFQNGLVFNLKQLLKH